MDYSEWTKIRLDPNQSWNQGPPPQPAPAAPDPTPPPAAPAPAPSGDQGFTDPYAKAYADAIGKLSGSLQQPVQNPDFGPMQDYLRKYFQQLQGPAYTPAQMDLIQTQATDPLEHARSQAKQQVIQRLAARGINPGSGVVERALQEVDRGFSEMRTRQQAGFATQAIGLDRANASQAAQVGQTISGLNNQQQGINEGRAAQGVGLLGQLPQLADNRQQLAMQLLAMNNPAASMGYAQQGQQYQNQNTQQMWANLFNLASGLFGGS